MASKGYGHGKSKGQAQAKGKEHDEAEDTGHEDGEGKAPETEAITTDHDVTVYAWKGFTTYENGEAATITDDDDQLDWHGQDSGIGETLTVDGETHDVHWSGTIETRFKDSEGNSHVEEMVYTYTSDGYYVVPMKDSAFDEGSTIKCFKGGWDDTDGIDYDEVICFTPGCRIDTDRGPVAAGTLRAGDRVQTADNGYQPVRWIGRSDLPGLHRIAANLHPVRIRKDAFGPGQPARDIAVSPQHRFCLAGAGALFGAEEMLAPAKGLVDGRRVLRDRAVAGISYVHLLFDRHEVIFCEGLATESFQPTPRNMKTLSRPMRSALRREVGLQARGYRAARPVLRPWEVPLLARAGPGLS